MARLIGGKALNNDIKLDLWRVLSAYIFVIILLIIVRKKKISREKQIIIATIRMTLQLSLVGYILIYIFDRVNVFFVMFITAIMIGFSIYTVISRANRKISPSLKKVIAISLSTGTIISLLYFLIVVINAKPWYDPKNFIPIAGMLIGNSMTGISLGLNNLFDGMYENREKIEQALMLGARPKVACQDVVKKAFDSAILPTINSMLTMGIVSLSGMMTGQILSGMSPIVATQYQIAIMLGILGSVSLSVIIFVEIGYRSFFNKKSQFILDDIDSKG